MSSKTVKKSGDNVDKTINTDKKVKIDDTLTKTKSKSKGSGPTIEEQFKKNKITFRGSLNQFDADGNLLENYDSSFKEFAAQDRDDRIDKKTGKKIMTNKILNASAGLQIELTKMEKVGDRSTGYVYIIRARLIDGATGTTICTTSKKFTKTPD